jgi:hypothetical protein
MNSNRLWLLRCNTETFISWVLCKIIGHKWTTTTKPLNIESYMPEGKAFARMCQRNRCGRTETRPEGTEEWSYTRCLRLKT